MSPDIPSCSLMTLPGVQIPVVVIDYLYNYVYVLHFLSFFGFCLMFGNSVNGSDYSVLEMVNKDEKLPFSNHPKDYR